MARSAGKVGFRVLLATLGLLLELAARVSRRFRAQVTRDTVIEVRTDDGVAHHYVFSASRRRVKSRSGRAPGTPELSLCFETAALGFVTLVRPDAVGRTVELLLARKASYTGNAAYVPWFWGLTRMVLPYGLQRPMKEVLPGALTAPDPTSKVADRITREPVAGALDPAWTEAHVAHRRMAMVRGSSGDDIPMW